MLPSEIMTVLRDFERGVARLCRGNRGARGVRVEAFPALRGIWSDTPDITFGVDGSVPETSERIACGEGEYGTVFDVGVSIHDDGRVDCHVWHLDEERLGPDFAGEIREFVKGFETAHEPSAQAEAKA